MPGGQPEARQGSRIVAGVDGSGRSHRLGQIAAACDPPPARLTGDSSAAEIASVLAGTGDRLLLVDDAHRLAPEAVRVLAEAARHGRAVALARRPAVAAELAALEQALGTDQVEYLQPLDRPTVSALLAAATGHVAPAELAASILAASAGYPAFAVPLARAATGRPTGDGRAGLPPDLLARVQRAVVSSGPQAAALAHLLALLSESAGASGAPPAVADAALAEAAGCPLDRLPVAVRTLTDAGLLCPGQERLVPVVAHAVLAELTGAERRAGHHRLAHALLAGGAGPVVVAGELTAAGVRTTESAGHFLAAAESQLWEDPEAALGWLDRAADAGAGATGLAARLAAGRAEVALLLGLDHQSDLPAPRADGGAGETTDEHAAERLALAAAISEIRQGRLERGGVALTGLGRFGAALGVPALIAAGRRDLATLDQAHGGATRAVPVAVGRLGEAVIASVGTDSTMTVPTMIEAIETADRTGPRVLWPDTPHAIAAAVAVAAGDVATAEHTLRGALDSGFGGPASVRRHRLLLAWARLRSGRYDSAIAEPHRSGDDPPSAVRDRFLAAVLAAGLARRRGDVAAMRALWPTVEPLLARRTVDLFGIEQLEELLVVAARLRHPERIRPVLDDVTGLVDRLGRPALWTAAAWWLAVQVAVALDDADRATVAAKGLAALTGPADVGPRSRPEALAAAAACWAGVLGDLVDPDPVLAAVDALATTAQLPWEASQLAGQAAIRCVDARLTRRLLERARELSNAETAAPAQDDGRVGALSEREAEVARLVLAGRTHREIGSQLFISAKTVEHHVARIRTKLGVQTRAEFVAALRALLIDDSPGGRIQSPISDSYA